MCFVQPDLGLPERFRVDALLAANDRCTLYRAFDEQAQRTVVLKQFRASDAAVYLRESAAGLALTHPNLLTCQEALYPDAETSCLVFDYMSAGTLRQRIDANGALARADLHQLIRDLLTALGHMHAAGYVHRDLKPDNVYLREGPEGTRFLLGDLGSTCTLAETRLGAAGAGAPAYSAPETWHRATTARSDLYSLGMLAFEAATGTLPFAPNFAAAKTARRHLDLGAIAEPALRDFLAMLLEPNPANRCPDAATALRIFGDLPDHDHATAAPLRLIERSRGQAATTTVFAQANATAPAGMKLLNKGSRHVLLLEFPSHGELLNLPLPCTRRSLPLTHHVMQTSAREIAFVAGQRLQLLDIESNRRTEVGLLPGPVLECRHDGRQALYVDASGFHLLYPKEGTCFSVPDGHRNAQGIRPACCLFEGGGFAASGGALNRRATFYDANARPGQSIDLPDSILALVPAENGFLHAVTLSTHANNRYTVWQLHRFMEPRRFQTELGIQSWAQCGEKLDLLFEDGRIGRVWDSAIDNIGRLPINPAEVLAFAVAMDGRAIAATSADDDRQLITLITST